MGRFLHPNFNGSSMKYILGLSEGNTLLMDLVPPRKLINNLHGVHGILRERFMHDMVNKRHDHVREARILVVLKSVQQWDTVIPRILSNAVPVQKPEKA